MADDPDLVLVPRKCIEALQRDVDRLLEYYRNERAWYLQLLVAAEQELSGRGGPPSRTLNEMRTMIAALEGAVNG